MEQEINTDAIIRLRDVDIYQKKQLVLSHVSFEINQAEFVYLVGKTGCGKSSLLKTMYCALPLKKGEMYIMEYDIPTIKKRDIPYLRRKIGIIFQDFQLLTDRNIKDNLIFVMRATGWKDKVKMNTRIEEVLALVGLETKDYKMPFELSGGEQQRPRRSQAADQGMVRITPWGELQLPACHHDTTPGVAWIKPATRETSTAKALSTIAAAS